MYAAFQGVYGAFVNTDGFTVGEEKETWAGIRLFEIAKEVRTVRHYVYSGLDSALRVRNIVVNSLMILMDKSPLVRKGITTRNITSGTRMPKLELQTLCVPSPVLSATMTCPGVS